MFSLHDKSARLCDGLSRREWLRVGGLSTLGLSLPTLLQASSAGFPDKALGTTFGKAKNVLFLWLQGGPPQHETFDPKPDAPAEIRGEFSPISTNVPGIHICELLPRTAAIVDKLAIVRSLSTQSDLHDASGYWILTGYKYQGQQSRQISPSDWPYLGSIVRMLKPSEKVPAFSSVWLPDVMRLNDNVTPAGQTAGFLGKRWEPQRLVCDPAAADFKIEGLALPGDVPPLRFADRGNLRAQVESHFDRVERGNLLKDFDRQHQEAWRLITSQQAREAFDLKKEPAKLRERYGLNKWGQSLLLGRRLLEAGARLVHVNWPREGGDEAVNNPMWDTHAQNADRLQDVLCPIFDVGFTTLMDDLSQRGMLEETLVVVIGEFGRTPKINKQGGRDHWGHVFSFALAGAGISGGRVIGSSDKQGAYPREYKMEPQDLTATMVHLLGIGHHAQFANPLGQLLHVTKGQPILPLLGTEPATKERVRPTGNLALVPEYSKRDLLNADFEDAVPLSPLGSGKRWKGWLATPLAAPLAEQAKGLDFGVSIVEGKESLPFSGKKHAALGYGLSAPAQAGIIQPGVKALLTQEIRNPRAGTYTITAQLAGGGNEADYRALWQHFRARLVLFGYRELTKNLLLGMREYASVPLQPAFATQAKEYQKVTLTYKLRSQEGGASEIEMGVGIAFELLRTSAGPLNIPAGARAFLRVDAVQANFEPRPRNDDVTV